MCMKLSNIIEGISPVVFHFTSLMSAGRIVKENRFRMSASYANDSESSTGSDKLFFLSVTRSRTGGYTARSASNQSVVMNLDGKALSNKYSGKPVQYWSRGMIQIDHKYDEMEDRIYSDTPFIENANAYITEIHVLLTQTGGLSVPGRKGLLELKKSKIPVFLYDDENSFVVQDKRKAKPLRSFTIPKKEPEERYPSFDRRASGKQERRRARKTDKRIPMTYGIERWLAMMLTPIEHWYRFSYNMRDMIRGLRWNRSSHSVLSADLHNSKNNPDETKTMSRVLKKHNLKSTQDIIDFIVDRWKTVVDD